MRWLIAMGLVVGACSGASAEGQSGLQERGGEGGEPATQAGASSDVGAAGAPRMAGDGGAAGDGPGSSGAGGEVSAAAGDGGEPAGAGGHGGGASPGSSGAGGGGAGTGTTESGGAGQAGTSLTGGAAGAGGTEPDPDPVDACAGVPAWDPQELFTELEKGDLRTLRGKLWRCLSPADCTTYPGHATAPGWQLAGACLDPKEGGEPKPQCTTGACCDGGFFRPPSYLCGKALHDAECAGSYVPSCGGKAVISSNYNNLFCSGDTGGDCTRWGPRVLGTIGDCPSGTACMEAGAVDKCLPCP